MIPAVCDEFVMNRFNFGYNVAPVWLNFFQKSLHFKKNIKQL